MNTHLRFILVVALLLCCGPVRSQIATHAVIAEVYGGGGNSGSRYKNDFIELYNPTSSPVAMSLWSVQYASASGSFGSANKTIFSGTIAPHGFFLIQEAQGSGGTTNLPAPDAVGGIAMAGTSGKVALVSDTVTISGPADGSVVDFLGYGSANQFEGSGAMASLSNTTSGERKAQASSTPASMSGGGADSLRGNGWDSGNNSGDFVVRVLPDPQNSSSPAEVPPVVGNLAPIISSLHRSPFLPSTGGTDTVTASIVDLDGSVGLVRLHVRVGGGVYDSSIGMTLVSGDQYRGVVPASKHAANGDLIEYYVTAADDSMKYASTADTLRGYFVGDASVAAVKSRSLAAVGGYGVRIRGTLNVRTNLFAAGQGFIQDVAGGLRLFDAGGLPGLDAGRNVRVQGTLASIEGAYGLTDPEFLFTDTSLGTTALVPAVVVLPLTQSPASLSEGKLVTIAGLSTDSTGTFLAQHDYPFHDASSDTITVRVESNGSANTLVGKQFPASPVNAIGILSFSGNHMRLKPRGTADMGGDPADGTGTASITPAARIAGASSIAETLSVAGDGANTIAAAGVAIPSAWTWTDTAAKSISGAGFASATVQVSGAGSPSNPYLITISGAAVTATNTGRLIIRALTVASDQGQSIFTVRTRGAAGSLSPIAASPAVNVAGTAFEAASSGNWSSPSTWLGGVVPGDSDDVSMSTLGVVVTVNVPNARCRDLTITGSGSAASSGPLLQFAQAGSVGLKVNGDLAITGGSGGGGGNRGGRAQLTSNGNESSALTLMGGILTTPSNSVSNGSAGLNMNEGTVYLLGPGPDTIRNNSGFRLGRLVIGDGIRPKIAVWEPTHMATLIVRSVTVKRSSTFWIGASDDSTANHIGNATTSGMPVLDEGIVIETDAAIRVQNPPGGSNVPAINLDRGGIRNDGTLDLVLPGSEPRPGRTSIRAPLGGKNYAVNVGGLSAGSSTATQTVSGSGVFRFGTITVGQGDTLMLERPISLSSGDTMFLRGRLVEAEGKCVAGVVSATRTLARGVVESFGGIGASVTAAGAAPGPTGVTRTTGVPCHGSGNSSIQRFFDVAPSVNAGLDATVDLEYAHEDLDGQAEESLQLWRSPDGGRSWTAYPCGVDTAHRTIHAVGIGAFSRWTASDAAHPLGAGNRQYAVSEGWNLMSVPFTVPDYRRTALFPASISVAFGFEGAYIICDTLCNAEGYWLKFKGDDTVAFNGGERLVDTAYVRAGWNLIGSISRAVPSASIVEEPPGLIISNLFGYNGTYIVADTIYPCKAYWVKTSAAGKLILGSGNAMLAPPSGAPAELRGMSSLTITDGKGRRQVLYINRDAGGKLPAGGWELPPPGPEGVFDARFRSGRYVEWMIGRVEDAVLPINMKGEELPLSIEWKMIDGVRMMLRWEEAGREGSVVLEGNGKTVVRESSRGMEVSDAKAISATFSMSTNYPNPFNPSTEFVIGIARRSAVRMEVANILGQRVRILGNGMMDAGYHRVRWDGNGENGDPMPAGVYFIRARGEDWNATRKVVLIR